MPHIHEKIDFCVEAMIVHKSKVLLRMHDKYKMWFSVGGHIELDEDPVEALYREVREEVGLDIEIVSESYSPKGDGINNRIDKYLYKYLIPPRYMGRHFVNDTHEHVVFIYFAKSETDEISESVLEHEKGVEVKWFSKEDLENTELVPNIKFYAMKALEELGE